MSSAFLYLAIVAIWAGVLVPRWLRPHVHRAEHEADGHHEAPAAEPPPPGRAHPPGPAHPPDRPARPARTKRHARVLKTRRRMLATLVLLTAGAAGTAVAHVTATWVIIPPAVVLAGFLTLLRAAARFDTKRIAPPTRTHHDTAGSGAGQKLASERDAARTRPAASGASPAAGPEREAVPGRSAEPEWEEVEPGWVAVASAADVVPSAEIIDISGRVRDQVYDQYSDAAERAVGD